MSTYLVRYSGGKVSEGQIAVKAENAFSACVQAQSIVGDYRIEDAQPDKEPEPGKFPPNEFYP